MYEVKRNQSLLAAHSPLQDVLMEEVELAQGPAYNLGQSFASPVSPLPKG